MALDGEISTFPLADLFAWLVARRASGVLSLTRGMTTRRFHLRRGEVRLVSSSEQEMLLGQLLIERKLLDAETLARTLAGRGRSRARLGRLLTRGGLVKPGQLQAILAEKVRRLLADALTWTEGRFFYEPSPEVADAGDRRPRARADSRWGIAVAVDLRAALEQIRDQAPTGAAGAGAPVIDDCVAVADDDVIEALPAGPST